MTVPSDDMDDPDRLETSFVVQLGVAASADEWRAQCRRVEQLGFNGISLPDHFGGQFAPLIALASAAEVTSAVRLYTNVLANDFRHPAVLAKELATLDVLSSGRVVAGIGAGWMLSDYQATGIAWDSPGVRIARLVESVEVLRGLWSGKPFSFHGSHYEIADLAGQPVPVQRPSIPILIGGGGPRILTEAARLADIVGLAPDNRAGVLGAHKWRASTAAAVRERVDWIRAASKDRPVPPVLSVRTQAVHVGDDAEPALVALSRSLDLDPAEVSESPFALIGSVDDVTASIRRHRTELGISSYVVSFDVIDELAPVVTRLAS